MRGHLGAVRRPGLSALALAAVLGLPAAAQAAGRSTYIVQLEAKPLASYTGGKRGIPATSPRATGRKLDRTSGAARAYRSFLASRQRAVLGRLDRRPRVLYSYRTALAGFSAELSKSEAARLRHAPEVALVRKDRLWQPQDAPDDALLGGDTGDGASYLDLTDPAEDPLWDRLGGPEAADGAGSGVVVGVIDTGIQPGHPSFADHSDSDTTYVGDDFSAPSSSAWHGTCESGDGFPASSCNHKLIGARYFVDGFGEENLAEDSFLSPRDDDGHGSHTTSTAAGNFGVDPVIAGDPGPGDDNDLGVDRISGISPRSWVAMYKICWNGAPGVSPSGCTNSDSVAAIDQAVADGVDVINYSIGSSSSAVFGSVEYAFLNAADAGVFVASSAGNDGPDPGTVGSPAAVPWLTAVAADTLHRTFAGTATVQPSSGPSFDITGASVTGAIGSPTEVVDAEDSGAAGVDPADAELCEPDSLDPAEVTGKIVLCLRGDNARIDKSHNVAEAGGAGMILYNPTDAQDRVTDIHWVPSIHVDNTAGEQVKTAIAAGTTTATLTEASASGAETPKVTAAFSSRGPQTAVPDIAKPDLAAPGVNILAAAADQPSEVTDLRPGQLFQSISGTSMASPHVAGAAALLTQAHPLLSPAAIKSSLMTTADPATLEEDMSTPAGVFDTGSGEIDPNRAVDPGLVMDVGYDDYVSYLAAVAPDVASGPKIEAKDLNVPSISISQLAGTASVTRALTSVDTSHQEWTATVSGLPGIAAAADPASFSISPGAKQDVTVDFEVTSAPLGEYRFGALTLTNGARTVRVPISVKPVALAAPEQVKVTTDQAAGSQDLPVQTGYAGTLSAIGWGLAAPSVHAGERIDTTTGAPDPSGGDPGTKVYPVDLPGGAQLLSARISDVDGGDPNTDLDLYVYRDDDGDGTFSDDELVDLSASGIAEEEITTPRPEAGHYGVAVTGFTTRPGGSVYDLTTWVVADPSGDDPSNPPGLQVLGEPPATTIGGIAPLVVHWSGVDAKGLYLGVVTYHRTASTAPEDAAATSIVELTKTTDTSPGGGTPPPGGGGQPPAGGGQPPAGGGNPPPAGKPKLRLKVRSVRAVRHRRVLRLRLRTSRPATVRAVVKHHGNVRARSAKHRVHVEHTVRVSLRLRHHRRLRHGHYVVKVIAVRAHRRDAARMRLRVGHHRHHHHHHRHHHH